MKISLLYNVVAGDGVSAESLCAEFERSGHELVQIVENEPDVEIALDDSAEIVVASGGDGTVWRAANALTGRRTPLAILPHGTANNIARALGIEGSTASIIAGWKSARLRPLDLGIASDGWGHCSFIEGTGGGLIPRGIAAMSELASHASDEAADTRVALAVRGYRDILSAMEPREWRIVVDGERIAGDFILVEVLNIRSVGPNFTLAPDADPFDGLLDVVLAGEEHRQALDEYLRRRIDGEEDRLSLPTVRARQVELRGHEDVHVDDEVRSGKDIGPVSIRVEPGALAILA